MQVRTNIAFIGGRGAGKSKISRKFSKLSERALFSTDTLISYDEGGLSIAKIVESRGGWPAFREMEYNVLKKLCRMENIIIDCGGGILVEAADPDSKIVSETFSERKASLLKSCAQVVYIKRNMEWLFEKNKTDSNRPELGGSYLELMERRIPWYEQTADLTIDMDRYTLKDALQLLMDKFGSIQR